MRAYFYIATLVFQTSYSQINNSSEKIKTANNNLSYKVSESTSNKIGKLTQKKLKFLWRENRYDKELKITISEIVINEKFCKTITEHERAALGYVATFIGNECNWEGDHTDDRSNLKCKILTALNLGNQCSDKHLGFLRQMFENDTKVLQELQSDNCPTTPDGSSIQDTFDEITLTVKGDEIIVFYKVNGVDSRDEISWNWKETDHFKIIKDKIKLIKKHKSKIKSKKWNITQ